MTFFDVSVPAQLSELLRNYGAARQEVLGAVFSKAKSNGVRWVVAEHRYVDADYRSEHTLLYSKTFRRYPSITHRLHLFRGDLTKDELAHRLWTAAEPCDDLYLGYSVVRPVDAAPVGRTVLAPPLQEAKYVACAATDRVNLFGAKLTARGAPFMSQDGQVGTCVHATVWACAYFHSLAYSHRRFVPAEIAGFTPGGIGRTLPSGGASVTQMSVILAEMGLPALAYRVHSPAFTQLDTDLDAVLKTYLDSGMPVIATRRSHAFVLVGYRNLRRKDGTIGTQYIRHDDQGGPYELVGESTSEDSREWEYVVIPLPRKLYMSGESAALIGKERLCWFLSKGSGPEVDRIRSGVEAGEIEFRATAVPSNELKRRIRDPQSQRSPEIVELYGFMQLPRWVWVVEAVHKASAEAGEPSVEAEALIDGTDHSAGPHILAMRIPGCLFQAIPDTDDGGLVEVPEGGRCHRITLADSAVPPGVTALRI